MTIREYRKKPVIIEAAHLTDVSRQTIAAWIIDHGTAVYVEKPYVIRAQGLEETYAFEIKTLEGYMTASYGDYIIKGVNGEFYPCKPDIFAKTYEELS
jgi:hypothetical protein